MTAFQVLTRAFAGATTREPAELDCNLLRRCDGELSRGEEVGFRRVLRRGRWGGGRGEGGVVLQHRQDAAGEEAHVLFRLVMRDAANENSVAT